MEKEVGWSADVQSSVVLDQVSLITDDAPPAIPSDQPGSLVMD